MSTSNYIDKKTLEVGDLIYYGVNEFKLPKKLFYYGRVKKINMLGIFIKELWCSKNMDLSNDIGLLYYDDVEINFGKEEWNGNEDIRSRLAEYFI